MWSMNEKQQQWSRKMDYLDHEMMRSRFFLLNNKLFCDILEHPTLNIYCSFMIYEFFYFHFL